MSRQVGHIQIVARLHGPTALRERLSDEKGAGEGRVPPEERLVLVGRSDLLESELLHLVAPAAIWQAEKHARDGKPQTAGSRTAAERLPGACRLGVVQGPAPRIGRVGQRPAPEEARSGRREEGTSSALHDGAKGAQELDIAGFGPEAIVADEERPGPPSALRLSACQK